MVYLRLENKTSFIFDVLIYLSRFLFICAWIIGIFIKLFNCQLANALLATTTQEWSKIKLKQTLHYNKVYSETLSAEWILKKMCIEINYTTTKHGTPFPLSLCAMLVSDKRDFLYLLLLKLVNKASLNNWNVLKGYLKRKKYFVKVGKNVCSRNG